jgi:hypothetical protein
MRGRPRLFCGGKKDENKIITKSKGFIKFNDNGKKKKGKI